MLAHIFKSFLEILYYIQFGFTFDNEIIYIDLQDSTLLGGEDVVYKYQVGWYNIFHPDGRHHLIEHPKHMNMFFSYQQGQ